MSDAPLHLLEYGHPLCGAEGRTALFPENVSCPRCLALYGSITIQNPRPENAKILSRHEQVTALKDVSAVGLSGEYIHEWVGQLSLRSADRLIQALHVAGYELVKK